ncbi:endoribonuclease L-PSP [Desulfovibrio sp. X2]|uniref:RidA family protein n=1 Tax=Desulfovibrio sp. X2 TaxID=941449 RepID=UPI000358F0BA|nr:RidA family protein [Desulfovibrio sp. X2]EPR40226.1 endoribonuclease L-PSP [Desulfovibrio sp. X2]
MDKKIIATAKAPAAIGPYSQAVRTGSLVFCSGQIPLDPKTGELVPGGIAEQAEQSLTNLAAVLEAAGSSLEGVVKTTCFLADLADFAAFNTVYAKFFTADCPARSTFQVAGLPKGARVEVEAVAVVTE